MMIVWFFVEVYGCHRDLHVLTHSFPTRRSSDLGFAPAEVVAVLGASGSGKSTLLRSIAGLQSLSAGGVELDALDVTDVEPHKRGVGLMFQDHALFPHRDVSGTVGFGLRLQGLPPAEVAARVTQLLDLDGLAGKAARANKPPSGGEHRR